MDVLSLISTVSSDLMGLYQIPWSVKTIEVGEGDINIRINPVKQADEIVLGFNVYFSYAHFTCEMVVVDQPAFMEPVFQAIESNGKANAQSIRAFETLFLSKGGSLSYKINGQKHTNKPLESFLATRWMSFAVRYESAFTEVYDRLNFYYDNFKSDLMSFAGFILLFSSYQQTEELHTHEEGREYLTTSTRYERNPINRELCLASKGYRCSVCGIDMGKVYGEIGKQFIEVHHSIPVSAYGHERLIDPLQELFPVCPNCHAMLHRKNPPYSIDELRQIMQGVVEKRGERL